MIRLPRILLLFFFLISAFSHFGQKSIVSAQEVKKQKILSFVELPEFNIPRGKIIYDRYCFFCHGNEGKGDGLNAFSLKKRPANLQKVLVDKSDKEIKDVIIFGGVVGNLSHQMPSYERTISLEELKQLKTYLRNKIQKELNATAEFPLHDKPYGL